MSNLPPYVQFAGGRLVRAQSTNPNHFAVEFRPSDIAPMSIFLTPEQAAQWVEVLTEHARGATA